MPYDDFRKWHSYWYGNYGGDDFEGLVRPGHAVVIDAQGIENTGFVGSNNTLKWFSRGMTGVVTNGNARDTDELILERIPVYYQVPGRRHETGPHRKWLRSTIPSSSAARWCVPAT